MQAVLPLLVVLSTLFLMQPALARADDGGYPYASYNEKGSNPAASTWTDSSGNWYSKYGYAYRNCTDFVAWKLATDNHFNLPGGIGNGKDWSTWAKKHDPAYVVDNTPSKGAVAYWDMDKYGHVAWVQSVDDDDTITIEEYNWSTTVDKKTSYDGAYHSRTIEDSEPSGYIHFKDLG
jgi:surface antigen